MNSAIEEKMKEFDKEFVIECENDDDGGHYSKPILNTENPNAVKSFLRSSLISFEKTVREEEREKHKIPFLENGWQIIVKRQIGNEIYTNQQILSDKQVDGNKYDIIFYTFEKIMSEIKHSLSPTRTEDK